MNTQTLKKLDDLRQERKLAYTNGDVVILQSVNYQIMSIAKKNGVDYYDIA